MEPVTPEDHKFVEEFNAREVEYRAEIEQLKREKE